MVRSYLFLSARPGRVGDLVRFYRDVGVLERARSKDGCLGAELTVPRSGEDPVIVTALWRDLPAYEAWVADPWRQESIRGIAEFLEAEVGAAEAGGIFDVVLEA